MKGNQILESHAPAGEAQEIQLQAEKVNPKTSFFTNLIFLTILLR